MIRSVKTNIGLLLTRVTEEKFAIKEGFSMAKASISVVKGKGSINHNNREFYTPNVDITRTGYNIEYVQQPLEEAYRVCFEKAINEYNSKQKRADRRIDGVKGYMTKIKNSKNGEKLFYENVVQVGNMQDSRVGTEQAEVCKQILDEYMHEFTKNNPNLYVFNAVMHLDEKTPHLHIDYIPLAHGYKTGLSVRNSLDRAFKEQGIEISANSSTKFDNRTIAWQNREKDSIERIMLTHGLERTNEKGLKRAHMSVEEYKAQLEHVDRLIENAPQIHATKLPLGKVMIAEEDLAELSKQLELGKAQDELAKEVMIEHNRSIDIKEASLDDSLVRAKDILKQIEERDSDSVKRFKTVLDMESKVNEKIKAEKELFDSYSELTDRYFDECVKTKELGEKVKSLEAELKDAKEKNETLKAEKSKYFNMYSKLSSALSSVCRAVNCLINHPLYKIQLLTNKQANLVDAINVAAEDTFDEIGDILGKEKCKSFAVDGVVSEALDTIERYQQRGRGGR